MSDKKAGEQKKKNIGLNNIYFEKLSHTNLQTEQSGFGRKLQACKDHLPKKILQKYCPEAGLFEIPRFYACCHLVHAAGKLLNK